MSGLVIEILTLVYVITIVGFSNNKFCEDLLKYLQY
jgi:hypothetical protein